VISNVRFFDEGSVANVQGIGSLPRVRLGRKLGRLPTATMKEIKHAIRWALELAEDEE
jgi:mRNA interferase MazF